MTDDIVARMRVWARWLDERVPDSAVGDDLRKSADEIERLRDLIEGHDHLAMGQRDQMKRLRWERDEARRKICEIESRGTCDPQKYASLMGWDCFKEAKP